MCEVKTRAGSAYGSPLEAVTVHKAARLRRLAAYWLEVHEIEPPALRIDVVAVSVPRRGSAHVEQIRGVA